MTGLLAAERVQRRAGRWHRTTESVLNRLQMKTPDNTQMTWKVIELYPKVWKEILNY